MVTTAIPSLIRVPWSLVILWTSILLSLLSFVSSDDHIWAAIPLGSKLSPAENRTWVSPEGTFAIGFYAASGQADEYSVGIWFNSIPAEARTMIWTAGEDLKVRLNASLQLTMDGNLVLFDYLHGVPAWTSNTSHRGVVGAVLMDNGNLVLNDSSHRTIWESFETPSDTLVPGQRLHVGQTLRAASRKSTSSYYNLLMERTGNLVLKWESNVSYWDSGTGSLPSDSIPIAAMFAGDGAFELFDSRGRIAWYRYSNDYTDTKVVLRYLRLDVDGNLRIYSWIQESQSWKSGWQAVENQCDVFATCGVYGVCSFNSMGPVCECPFEGRSDATMESDDPGNGCRKLVSLGGCKDGGGITMLAMKRTVLYGLYPPHDVPVNTSSEKCKEQCLNDDYCVAATAMNDGSGLCRLKRTEFISGYTYGSVAAVSFLKKCLVPEAVPSQSIPRGTGQPSLSPSSSSASNLSHGSAPGICRVCLVGASLGTLGAFIVIEVGVGLCIFKKRRRGKALQSGKLALLNTTNTGTLIRLSFSEVQELTRNFKEKLGSSVYKGVLSNNKAVAIKQFNMEVGEKHLRMTLSTLGSIHHRNLIQLQGFCCESKHRFLIYEYISNGSLAQWLFGGSTKKQAKRLTWQRRLGIATGIARAISYLHSECRECIPHGNLKLENVLLDDDFTAKVTDFGLGKLKAGSISFSSSESSPERDVFRFGEMLLEIITGKRERDSCESEEKSNTNSGSSVCRWSWEWAYQEYQMGHLESIADCRMEGNVDWNEVERALKIALWCIGKEGRSKFEWLREDKDLGEYMIVSRGDAEYTLTEEDVGQCMVFVYTPVNWEGQEGKPSTAVTGKVLHAPPRVTQLRIVGDLREGNKVAISAIVSGGIEGTSRVQWFKTNSPDIGPDESSMEAISTSKVAKAFRIPLGAVGHYLVAKYTPVASDGESGEVALVISDKRVETLPPSLNFLSITGDLTEGETLTASYGYIGGHEGNSDYSWYLHEYENDPGTFIPEAEGQLQYQITKDAAYKYVSFSCIPVRDDGVIGEGRTTISHDRVRPGSPRILSLQILGESVEGAELQAEKKYWGGDEGPSKLQWFLTRPDGSQREIKGATGISYTVRKEDIDGLISVSCEPIRVDGARGPIVLSHLVGPILPGPPSCESLELHGQPVEGGRLSFSVIYKGGERGSCIHEWIRQKGNGRMEKISNNEVLDLTCEDVGSRIELVFTPCRKDGFKGTSQKVLSDVIADAEPVGIDLVIPDCYEDKEVVPQKSYYGGIEGVGQYTWYQVTQELTDIELSDACDSLKDAKVLATSMTYIPKLEDVGAYLVVRWVPARKDGKLGKALIARSRLPVAPAAPAAHNVAIKELSPSVYIGEGEYYGGLEGNSQISWYRETEEGTMTMIVGASSKSYEVTYDDYTCRLYFGYLPIRLDGVVGELSLSEPSNVILPEVPKVQKLVLTGKAVEGEILTAVEVIPKSESQQIIWEKYKKDVKHQWLRSSESGAAETFEPLLLQRSCSYKVRLEDVGCCLRCECVVTDTFGRSAEPVSAVTGPVSPGMPKIDKLEIEGRGYHTNLYAVRGIYSGGKEGKSKIQWLRSMVGSPDLISIPGEIGRMYEANVDDVGYRLVAVYTPVREDGVEGIPVSTSTDQITVEPEVLKEVKQKLELGAVKFEALRDRDRSPMKSQVQGLGSLERRILDVNRKRVKVVKPGSKTSFPNTEIRGSYAPPFHVELFRNDQHRLKIVIDSENEVDLMVQTRHMRDVIVLVIRGLAQRFNSTSLNSLLKM